MAKKLPYIMLFTGDWLKDPCLSLCGAATRGIWIDMIVAMHEQRQCGELVGTAAQLARLCRCSADEIVAAINELDQTRTANVERDITVTCHGDVTGNISSS